MAVSGMAVSGRPASARRNVALLIVCQALCYFLTSVMLAVSALAGYHLAADKSLATLPHAIQWLSTMAMALPAAMLMRRLGRRNAFRWGASLGTIGALIAAYALFIEEFWWFACATVFTGAFNSFAMHYRFAAAEAADVAWRSRAISFVVGVGIISAFVGPELAKLTKDLFTPHVFAGTFLTLAVIPLLLLPVLNWVEFPAAAERDAARGRPIGRIARQPNYIVAVLSAMTAWGTMVLLMTATPIAMIVNGHSFADAAFVIQWHIFGMFAPSFVSGWLIERFGVLNIMLCGLGLAAAAISFGLSGMTVTHFWLTNVCIGVGWNLLFVSGTTLLVDTYRSEEKSGAQGLNDFTVFGTVAAFSFTAGYLQSTFGWPMVNMIVIPWIIGVACVVLWLKLRWRRAAGSG
jgi:MFS family permease